MDLSSILGSRTKLKLAKTSICFTDRISQFNSMLFSVFCTLLSLVVMSECNALDREDVENSLINLADNDVTGGEQL